MLLTETTQNSKFQTDEKPFQITNGSGGECQANHQTSEENLGQSSSHIAARVPSAQQQNNWNSYLSYDSTKENSNAAAFCSVAQVCQGRFGLVNIMALANILFYWGVKTLCSS